MPERREPRSEFRVEPLGNAHDRAAFRSGVGPLDDYLSRQARQDVARRVAVCFILTPDGRTVAGFYTLSQYSVDLEGLPEEFARRLPRYPKVPATLIGRLAVGAEFRGQGLGEFLLLDALRRAFEQSKQIASALVVVDAKDEAARRFYEHFHFLSLLDAPNRLFLPMKVVERLFAESES